MRSQHVLTLVTGLIECICFAGVTFGWASLVFVLKKENYFENLCPDTGNQTTNGTNAGCPSQDEQFSLVFTIAAFMNSAMTFPGGYIFDRFGTAVTRFIAICLYTAATLLIALSTADAAALLFPALSLLATGGIFLILTNMQVGNLFGSQRSTIITLYNGAFDSSSVIFLVVKVLYQNGISLQDLFLFISCCSICHVIRTMFLMPKTHIPFPVPDGYRYGLDCGKLCQKTSRSLDKEKEQKKRDASMKPLVKSDIEVSFRSCVLSSLFWWHLVWLSLMQLRHYLFIGTLNPTITHLSRGDPELVSKYTNVFAISQFCGVFCAPWNGLIMDRHKRKHKGTDPLDDLHSSVLSLFLTSIQCVLFSLCASISQLPALYPTFIFQVLNRSFLYGGNAAFLSIAFPLKHFGKLYGLVMSLSALVSLLQYPAFSIIGTYLSGDPFYVNVSLLILVLLTFGHPINVFRVWRQKKQLRDKEQSDL